MTANEYVPDNYDAWSKKEREEYLELSKLPLCAECGEPIQDDYCYELENGLICEDCMENNHRVNTEDYM